MDSKDLPPVIDLCCGSKMFYFSKETRACLFMDNRELEEKLCDERILRIQPDVIGDFRNIPYLDNSFYLAVFDPPHLIKVGSNSWLAKKYGRLEEKTWKEDLTKGFKEAFRVLKPNGTLIFKWNEEQIKLSDILKVPDYNPLFGNQRGKTHFIVFLKNDECRKIGNENIRVFTNQTKNKKMKVFTNCIVNVEFAENYIPGILQQFEIDGLYVVVNQIDFEQLLKFQQLCEKYLLILNVVINDLDSLSDDVFYLIDYLNGYGRHNLLIKYPNDNFNLLKQIFNEKEDTYIILNTDNPYKKEYKNISSLNYKNTLFIEGKGSPSHFYNYNNKKQKYNVQKLYDDDSLEITNECLMVCKDSIRLFDTDEYAKYLDRIELKSIK